MKGSLSTTMMLLISDNQGALIARESPQEPHLGCPVKTSDLGTVMLDNSLGIAGCLVGSEVRKKRGPPKI